MTPRRLGRAYELDELIGRGAMGEVWRGRNTETGDAIAAKLLRSEYTADPEVIQRFLQERTIVLALSHPSLVPVRDLVVEGDDLAIVMDLVEGGDLRSELDRHGRLRPAEAVRLTIEVLAALSVIHASRVLHRDVKPENVLLDRTGGRIEPKLSDFGIARLAEGTAVKMSQIIGTPEYLAPEVIVSEIVSPAADVYAVGVMFYEMLAGRTPFAGKGTMAAIINRQVTAQPPALVGAPPELMAIADSLLVKDPQLRIDANAAIALLREAASVIGDPPVLAEQPSIETWQTDTPTSVAGDGEGTILRGGRVTSPDDLAAAPVWVQSTDGDQIDGQTRTFERAHVSREAAPPAAPLVPEEAPPSASNRKKTYLAAGVTAVLILGVSWFVLVGGGKDGGDDRPPLEEAVAVTQTTTETYGLLATERIYTLDPRDDGTYTFTAAVGISPIGDVSPRGLVIELLPRNVLEASAAAVTPSARATVRPVGADQIAGKPISWEIELLGDGPEEVVFSLPEIVLPAETDPEEFLVQALALTDAALRQQLDATTTTDGNRLYQAASALRVVVTGDAVLGSRHIDYAVYLQIGADEANRQTLYSSLGDAASTTDFLTVGLGGDEKLSIAFQGDGCSISAVDRQITATQEGTCILDAALGGLQDQTTLTVRGA